MSESTSNRFDEVFRQVVDEARAHGYSTEAILCRLETCFGFDEREAGDWLARLTGTPPECEPAVAEHTTASRQAVPSMFYSPVLEHLPVAIALLEPGEGRLVYANPRMLTRIGADKEDLANQRLTEFPCFYAAGSDFHGRIDEALKRAERHETSHLETHLQHDGRQVVRAQLSFQPIGMTVGRTDWVILTLQEIPSASAPYSPLAAEDLHDELQDVHSVQLHRLDPGNERFLARLDHALRTPLSSVSTLTALMQLESHGALNEKQRHELDLIASSSRQLLKVMDGLLNFARAYAATPRLMRESLAIDDACRKILLGIEEAAERKSIAIEYRISDPNAVLLADPRHFELMLGHLLDNAIKFTAPEGRIGLQVICDNDLRSAAFTVWDTGIGIPSDRLKRSFWPFTSSQDEAAGIGLALVERLADLHGGGISVVSRPGEGSRFTLRLPGLSISDARTTPAAPSEAPSRVIGHILVVEDDEINLTIARDYLLELGHSVSVARNGLECLDAVSRCPPDLILMDIQMPLMDGLTATRRIRASRDAYVASTPILALTALVISGDREACLEAGCDDYLPKPAPLDQLRNMIEEHLTRRFRDRAFAVDRPGSDATGAAVLKSGEGC